MKSLKLTVMAGMSTLLMGLSMMPGPVAAQEFYIGPDGVRIMRPDYDRRYDRRDDRRYDRDYGRPGCTPRQALATASNHLYEPRINAVRRGYYDIRGFGMRGGNKGRPDGMRLSTAPGCQRV